MGILEELADNLENGESDKIISLVTEAIRDGLEPREILDRGLIAGMNVVGAKFKKHEIFLPDVLLAAKAMYSGMDILKPLLLSTGASTIGKVVIGTVQGDLHDIGKNLVGIMLKGAGFEVIDLGKDVAPERFINTAIEQGATVVGMSALLTTTMPVMKQVIDLARERSVYGTIKFIVGGAPLTNEYAREIGAHSHCFDSISAVDCVKSLLSVA